MGDLVGRVNELSDKFIVGELTGEEIKEYTEKREELQRLTQEALAESAKEKKEKSREMKQRRWRGRYGEQRLAKKVGGVVVGRSKYVLTPTGKGIKINHMKPPDVVTDMFSFESKWLSHFPANIRKVMVQARSNCPEGLIPVGVIGDRNEREVVYILSEHDWLELHGGKK